MHFFFRLVLWSKLLLFQWIGDSLLCDYFLWNVEGESARQHGRWKWKWKDLKSASLEMRKTIMAPKWLRWNVNKLTAASTKKWKLANHGLKSRNNEVGIIKPRMLESLAECLTELCASDFYWIFFSFRLSLIF